MASQWKIELSKEHLQAFNKKLDALQKASIYKKAMLLVVADIRAKVATYPKPIAPGVWRKAVAGRPDIRRAFFASLGPGAKTRKKYSRTTALGKGWTTSVKASALGVTGTVGNNVFYAPYVQGPQQQPYFKRRWRTVRASRTISLRLTKDIFRAAIKKELQK